MIDDFLIRSAIERNRSFGNMFGKSRYFGLTGTRLNIAVGVLAGIDFW